MELNVDVVTYIVISIVILIISVLVKSGLKSYGSHSDEDLEDNIADMKTKIDFMYDQHSKTTEDGVPVWYVTSRMREMPDRLEKFMREINNLIDKMREDNE